jgi:hypothetical protein
VRGSRVAKRGDHDLAHAVLGEEVVGNRVALASGLVSIERHRALAVEMIFAKVDGRWSFAERDLILDWSESRLLGAQ